MNKHISVNKYNRLIQWFLGASIVLFIGILVGGFVLFKEIRAHQKSLNRIGQNSVKMNQNNVLSFSSDNGVSSDPADSAFLLVDKVMNKPRQTALDEADARILSSSPLCANGMDKPATYLQSYANKPVFRPGYTLPRLSHFAWGMQVDTGIELTANWGYALEMGDANDTLVTRMKNPTTSEGKKLAKALEDPEKYPLQVNIDRWIVPTSAYPKEAWLTDANGRFVLNGTSKIFSTEAPVSFLRQLAEKKTEPLRQIADMAHIAIILHGGESDLGVSGFDGGYAAKDPKATAAKGLKSWDVYFAEKKGYQESLVTDAVRSAVPDRQAYIFYGAGTNGTLNYGQADAWSWNYDTMRNVADIPGGEEYYNFSNNGYAISTDATTGTITNNSDMLTKVLNAVGRQIAVGEPLSYNWITAGWWGILGRLDLYLGFMKAYYTAGNIGSIAGYYDYPGTTADMGNGIGGEGYSGFDSCFDPNIPFVYANRTVAQPNSIPHWLTQMTVLSQAHALFSWLEPFERNGDLVEGPGKNFYSKDKPAYELPTGFVNTRVVVRKMKNSDQWIVTAWAADGITRNVTVTLRNGLAVTVQAIPEAHVYYVTPQNAGSPVLIDTDANYPSQNAKVLWDNNILPHS